MNLQSGPISVSVMFQLSDFFIFFYFLGGGGGGGEMGKNVLTANIVF